MKETNRQDLPPGLWVVATPIGNLEDITLRAIRALKEAEWIFCEDTRRTLALFSALKISIKDKQLIRMDAHTSAKKAQAWAEGMSTVSKCALVTDAGTPSVSDPGSLLVRAAVEAGIRVVPVPGCSAVPALLSISGLTDTAFGFRGFFPRKASERKNELELAASDPLNRTWIWYESPERILDTLSALSASYPDAQLVVAKELTKLHEQIFYGSSTEVFRAVQEKVGTSRALGEWCFTVQFAALSSKHCPEVSEEAQLALRCLLEGGVSVSRASQLISQYFGTSKRGAYQEALSWAEKLSEKKGEEGG